MEKIVLMACWKYRDLSRLHEISFVNRKAGGVGGTASDEHGCKMQSKSAWWCSPPSANDVNN